MNSPVWVISGASRGLGRELVRAAHDHGGRVVAGSRRGARGAEAGDGGAGTPESGVIDVEWDVTVNGAAENAVSTALETFGRLDVVVANAGRHLRGAVEEITDAESRAVFDVNFFGALATVRAALPALRAQGSGRIVLIGSMSGIIGQPGAGLYNATKFALEGLAEALSSELSPFGISVTVVEPGGLRTDFLDGTSLQSAESLAAYDDTPAGSRHRDWVASANHRQSGDPARAAEVIVRAALADQPPMHLLLGGDAIAAWEEKKVPQMEADLAVWRSRSEGIRFDPAP